MKTKQVIKKQAIKWMLIFYGCVYASTASVHADPFKPGKIINPVICKTDPTQSYALYIPAKGDKEALPVIYFFDAHGDGALPLNKYKLLADAYGFILIGSNNSKNGNDWSITENIWRHLFDDTQNRLKINGNRIYTGGFSGGAKVAGYVALWHSGVKGVLANGAGLPDGTPAGDFNFSFTAIAGEGDLNLTDLIVLGKDLDKTRTRHRMILFDGKHEWAPVSSMNTAFAGLQFDAMREALIPKDEPFINRYVTGSKNRFDSYYKTHQLIKAGQECQLSGSLLDGLTRETGWFKEKTASLANNVLYQKQQQAQENLLASERHIKAGFQQQWQQGDSSYWAKTINDLQAKALAKTAERGMYQRLLAYLSLAFYSFSNHLINGDANIEAGHFVALYKLADPTNSEAWYFSAILHARASQTHAAETDLLKAVGYGFRDRGRLMQQPEFKNLFPPINLSAIEHKMLIP